VVKECPLLRPIKSRSYIKLSLGSGFRKARLPIFVYWRYVAASGKMRCRVSTDRKSPERVLPRVWGPRRGAFVSAEGRSPTHSPIAGEAALGLASCPDGWPHTKRQATMAINAPYVGLS
jgi:hypothetical protein